MMNNAQSHSRVMKRIRERERVEFFIIIFDYLVYRKWKKCPMLLFEFHIKRLFYNIYFTSDSYYQAPLVLIYFVKLHSFI